MDMPKPPAPKSKLWMIPVGLVALALLILIVSYVVHLIDAAAIDPQVKENADFIAEVQNYTAYLPCRQEDISFPNDVDTAMRPLSSPQSDKPMLWFSSDIGARLAGYNDSGEMLPFIDYAIRGIQLTPSKKPNVLKGGKLGGERSKEFLTRGIQIGDSVEEVERILGAPDKPTENGQYAFYYFDTEESGQYLLRLEYSEQKLSMIDLSYTFHS